MKISNLVAFILSALLVGCAQQQKRGTIDPRMANVSRRGVAPAPFPAPEVPLPNQENVRGPETVKAYAINRYVDPANARYMHERHVLYRIDEDPQWQLRVPSKKQILIGPTFGDGKQELAPAVLGKELAAIMENQRKATARVEAKADMLANTAITFSKVGEQLDEIAKNQSNTILNIERRMANLEQDVRNKTKDK